MGTNFVPIYKLLPNKKNVGLGSSHKGSGCSFPEMDHVPLLYEVILQLGVVLQDPGLIVSGKIEIHEGGDETTSRTQLGTILTRIYGALHLPIGNEQLGGF
jgi:hypothetical protein